MKYPALALLTTVLLLLAASCETATKRPDDTQPSRDAQRRVASNVAGTTGANPGTRVETPPDAPAGESVGVPFPPEAVDHLAVTLSVELDLSGVGKAIVDLRGTAVIHRSGPTGPEGKTIKGDLIALSLRGTSDVFGQVVAMESPIQHSPCEYTYEDAGRYRGRLTINGWFWLPEHDLLVFSARPIHVEGSARSIPAIRQKGQLAIQDTALFDFRSPADKSVGTLVQASVEIHDIVHVESYLRTIGTTVPFLGKSRRP